MGAPPPAIAWFRPVRRDPAHQALGVALAEVQAAEHDDVFGRRGHGPAGIPNMCSRVGRSRPRIDESPPPPASQCDSVHARVGGRIMGTVDVMPTGEGTAVVAAARAGDERRSARSPSATGPSCRSTATGCSGRWRTRRTSCRRRSCGRGAGAGPSRGARRSGRGSGIATNASLDAVASKRRRVRAPAGEGMASEVSWLQPCRTGYCRPSRRARTSRTRARLQGDHRTRVPRRHPAPAADAAGGADRRVLGGEGDRRAPRDERARRQQRAAAGAGDPEGRACPRAGPSGRPARTRARPSGPSCSATWTPPSATTSTASPR